MSFLHFHGERVTPQRLAAARVALRADGPRGPEELVRVVNRTQAVRLGSATARRVLELLAEAGLTRPRNTRRSSAWPPRAPRF